MFSDTLFQKISTYPWAQCVVPEIIHTTPTEGHWKFLGGGGV